MAEHQGRGLQITTTPQTLTADKTVPHSAEAMMLILDNLNNMVIHNIHINLELINMQTRLEYTKMLQYINFLTTVSCAVLTITAALNVLFSK